MSTQHRAMKRLSARLISLLPPPSRDDRLIPAVESAISRARGRPVRLREAAFPPATASGVWLDRTDHDLIVFEQNTNPEHQLVIIGHETWHMFQGHCTTYDHFSAASRGDARAELTRFLAVLSSVCTSSVSTGPGPDSVPTDAPLHFAARADKRQRADELEAEHFGFRFATDVRTAADTAGALCTPHELVGNLQASMAHRFR
ncbi:toxin-antitoxin system, toxin component [Streptomyces sp. SBST2-5]|uniref:Toxin-antitoxin system, toxin component n=1 Tax=Streptomyces composti TaxID=2720025 RepID=A0ABX1A1U3_9ACTN|nr:toxin-antitoxin system, toxin component [Streptomyces composti]NJP50215.1 toxin-antitoxin system, toxin component [Streptomyces composti]